MGYPDDVESTFGTMPGKDGVGQIYVVSGEPEGSEYQCCGWEEGHVYMVSGDPCSCNVIFECGEYTTCPAGGCNTCIVSTGSSADSLCAGDEPAGYFTETDPFEDLSPGNDL